MPIEPPTSSDLPWMVRAPLGDWIKFHLKQESIVKSENEKGWSCYIADMRFPGGEYEDDDHEVPFWAMEAMFDAYNEQDKDKGWAYYRYKRTHGGIVDGHNMAKIEVFAK